MKHHHFLPGKLTISMIRLGHLQEFFYVFVKLPEDLWWPTVVPLHLPASRIASRTLAAWTLRRTCHWDLQASLIGTA